MGGTSHKQLINQMKDQRAWYHRCERKKRRYYSKEMVLPKMIWLHIMILI